MDFINLHTAYLILHLLGVAVGAGAALTGDLLFFIALSDKKISKDEFKILKSTSTFVWIGLTLLVFSGIGLFSLNSAELLESSKFLAKMTIILILLINGLVFGAKHLPAIEARIGKPFFGRRKTKPNEYSLLFASGVVSVVSWVYAIVLGTFNSLPFSYSFIMSSYLVALFIGGFFAYREAMMFGSKPNARGLIKSMVLIGVALCVFLAMTVTGYVL